MTLTLHCQSAATLKQILCYLLITELSCEHVTLHDLARLHEVASIAELSKHPGNIVSLESSDVLEHA